MKRDRRIKLLLALSVFILVASVVLVRGNSSVVAQSGGGYDLEWNASASGGATFSTGGGYELGGTAAQPEAGTLNAGGYSFNGGFWYGINSFARLFLPMILR